MWSFKFSIPLSLTRCSLVLFGKIKLSSKCQISKILLFSLASNSKCKWGMGINLLSNTLQMFLYVLLFSFCKSVQYNSSNAVFKIAPIFVNSVFANLPFLNGVFYKESKIRIPGLSGYIVREALFQVWYSRISNSLFHSHILHFKFRFWEKWSMVHVSFDLQRQCFFLCFMGRNCSSYNSLYDSFWIFEIRWLNFELWRF